MKIISFMLLYVFFYITPCYAVPPAPVNFVLIINDIEKLITKKVSGGYIIEGFVINDTHESVMFNDMVSKYDCVPVNIYPVLSGAFSQYLEIQCRKTIW